MSGAKWVCFPAVCIALLSSNLKVEAQQLVEPHVVQPSLALPKGASLEQAMDAVQRATGGVVLAEVPDTARTLDKGFRELGLSEALREISRAYHLHPVRRGRSVVFIRRLWDPDERLNLEIPEMTAVVADMDRWLRPLNYHRVVNQVYDLRAFARGLTPAQVSAMQNGGLPFTALSTSQRALWNKQSQFVAFGGASLSLDQAAQMFSGWSRCDVRYDDPISPEGRRFYLFYPYTDSIKGVVREQFYQERSEPRLPPAPQPSEEVLPQSPRSLPAAFRRAVRFARPTATFGSLAAAVAAAAQCEIDVPAYARGRRVIARVEGAAAEEVLGALSDLYGWEFAPGTGRRWHLRRPRFEPARDFQDLQDKLRAAIPPTARLLIENTDANEAAHEARRDREVPQILAAIAERKGRRWETAAVAELDRAVQQRLANILFELWLRKSKGLLSRQQPYSWIATPEAGLFHLRGELGPGRKPLLELRIQWKEGNGYRFEMCGVWLGTEKLSN